jgi:hypothetical protein
MEYVCPLFDVIPTYVCESFSPFFVYVYGYDSYVDDDYAFHRPEHRWPVVEHYNGVDLGVH